MGLKKVEEPFAPLQALYDVPLAGHDFQKNVTPQFRQTCLRRLHLRQPGRVIFADEHGDGQLCQPVQLLEIIFGAEHAGDDQHGVEAFRLVDGDAEGADAPVADAGQVETAVLRPH